MCLSVGIVRYHDFENGRNYWHVNARSADGVESWTAHAEDLYEAVVRLAEILGFELEDG